MDPNGSSSKTLIAEAYKKYIAENMNYSFIHSIVILVVVCMSLYNLTIQKGDVQLWRDLLLFSFGLVIPTPKKNINTNE